MIYQFIISISESIKINMKAQTLEKYLFINLSSISNKPVRHSKLLSKDFIERIRSDMQLTPEYIHLLLYLREKIYYSIASNTQSTVDEFITIYQTMDIGDIAARIKLLFKIFDFNKNGIIKEEEIIFFFNQFYVVKYRRQYYKQFKSVIKEMQLKSKMSIEMFIQLITYENSDVLYLLYIFNIHAGI